VLACPHCGSRMRLIATVHAPRVIRQILAHLGLTHSESGSSVSPACALSRWSDAQKHGLWSVRPGSARHLRSTNVGLIDLAICHASRRWTAALTLVPRRQGPEGPRDIADRARLGSGSYS
jgi:hypothetical protein